MIKKLSILNIIIVLTLFGCSSMKIKEKIEKKLQPLPLSERIVVIEENESIIIRNEDIKIGIFEIKDGGLTFDCDYDKVKNMAKQKARIFGGNSVKILEHKLPDTWSTCHRIKFAVYKLSDTKDFQTEKVWSEKNKLNWELFKGTPKVERSSFFCGYIDVEFNEMNFPIGKGKVDIVPIFLFDCSYVQPLKKSKYLLEYNKVKFDLLEFYSRKMRSEFKKANIDSEEKWLKFAKKIYNDVYKEYETDIFNLEAETNFGEEYSGLLSWKFKSKENLKSLKEFSTENY
jgi:hypothetical protein